MAKIIIPDRNREISNVLEIKQFLNERGIWFDQWKATESLSINSSQEEILSAYAYVLNPYMESNGYKTADVINISSETPNLLAIRQKFLKEHTHSEDEVRFFVDGQGYFWFNLEEDENVFCVLCEAGDLISVPLGTPHWFNLGETPFVKAIRIFIDTSGWVPDYTDSGIDAKYNPNYQ